jgi:hypothetical protein
MENQDYEALETHFNGFDASKLRGLVSENSAIRYAAYVLDRIAPQKALNHVGYWMWRRLNDASNAYVEARFTYRWN